MQVPPGRKVTRIELLRSGRDIPFRTSGPGIEFTVSRIDDYEVAAIYAA